MSLPAGLRRNLGPNPDSKLIKISYQWGNLAPIAKASANPAAGREPLTISLSSAGSKDIEGDPLRFEWQLFQGAGASPTNTNRVVTGKFLSAEANPSVTLDQPGNYIIQLTVSDDQGRQLEAQPAGRGGQHAAASPV